MINVYSYDKLTEKYGEWEKCKKASEAIGKFFILDQRDKENEVKESLLELNELAKKYNLPPVYEGDFKNLDLECCEFAMTIVRRNL